MRKCDPSFLRALARISLPVEVIRKYKPAPDLSSPPDHFGFFLDLTTLDIVTPIAPVWHLPPPKLHQVSQSENTLTEN